MNAILNMETAMQTATPAPEKAAPLQASAMLVSLNIRQWEGRKLDKAATAKVTLDANASANAARVTKSLVSKAALAEIAAIAGKARAEHYRRALPWSDGGTRVLSNVGYLAYCEAMRGLRDEFNQAVERFLVGYPDFVESARLDLGDLFDAGDYPSAGEIKARFMFPRPRIFPIPSASDFRVDIGAEFIADERREIEASLRELTETAIRDVFSRIAETVGTMAEKLKAFKPAGGKGGKAQGIFRDSLIENVRELVAVMPSLNITGDSRLADFAARMASICELDADDLRRDETARNEIAEKAAQIAADVSAYF